MDLGFLVVGVVKNVEEDVGDFEFVEGIIFVDFEFEFFDGIFDSFCPLIHLILIEYFKQVLTLSEL
jgi:hypothetical protein